MESAVLFAYDNPAQHYLQNRREVLFGDVHPFCMYDAKERKDENVYRFIITVDVVTEGNASK